MNNDEMKALASTIVQTCFEAGVDADNTKMQMFAKKIPFSKLNALYRSLSIELGHMVDPKKVTDEINAMVVQVDWEPYEEWAQVEKAINSMVDNVDGATSGRVLTLVRSHCKEEEITLPKKPAGKRAGGARGGKIGGAVVDLLIANPSATKADCYAALVDLVSGENKHDNILYYINLFYTMAYAVANKMTLVAATEALKAEADPANNLPVAEVADEVEADEDEGEEEELE